MSRITNGERDNIITSESNRLFYDRRKELKLQIATLLTELVKKTVPKWCTQERIDSGYIHTRNDVSFSNYPDMYRRELQYKFKIDSYLPCAAYEHKVPFSQELIDLWEKLKDLEKEDDTFRSQLRQILYSYNTSKELIEAMPELEKYFESAVNTMAVIPYEQIKQVREKLAQGAEV